MPARSENARNRERYCDQRAHRTACRQMDVSDGSVRYEVIIMQVDKHIPGRSPAHRLPLSHWGFEYGSDGLQYGRHSIPDLVKKHGTPFYLFMEQRLRCNTRNAREIARNLLPGSELYYSVKTNGHPGVLRIIHEENLGAEVISRLELDSVRATGFPGSRIIFNGPGKADSELREAVQAGIHINVESLEEARALCRIAGEEQTAASAGVRINLDVFGVPVQGDMRMVGAESVFGMDPRSPDFRTAVRCLTHSAWVRFHALSAHSGTGNIDTTPYRELASKMVSVQTELASDDYAIDTFDLGGGFSVASEVRYPESVFDSFVITEPERIPSPTEIATFEQCCRAVANELKDCPPVSIIFEPGRLLISDAFHLVTRVVRLKSQHDTRFAILDASRIQNALFVGRGYHEIIHVRDPMGEPRFPYTLVGPLCAGFDVFARDRHLPGLQEGAPVLVCDVGAYNLSAQSNWSFKKAPVVPVGV